ncbi:hypothetical protein Q5M85_19545 [Paraclostridium bifermentans]|nr:hypothetical protein [Paraclostridium bifermentans]
MIKCRKFNSINQTNSSKENDIDKNIDAIKNSDIVVVQLETHLETIKYALKIN